MKSEIHTKKNWAEFSQSFPHNQSDFEIKFCRPVIKMIKEIIYRVYKNFGHLLAFILPDRFQVRTILHKMKAILKIYIRNRSTEIREAIVQYWQKNSNQTENITQITI